MKAILTIFFLFAFYSGYCQTDKTLLYAEWELRNYLEETPECRVKYESDSLLKMAAKADAERSFASAVKTYYRIGHAGAVSIDPAQQIALKEKNLLLIYTHCTPCKYQVEYNKVFEPLYEKEQKGTLYKLVREIEARALEAEKKKWKKELHVKKRKIK